MTTPGERIVRVEVQLGELKTAFDEHKNYTHSEFKNIEKKLDDLITLRNKGFGVFWLMSVLVGTGVVGLFFQILSWFRSP